MPSVLIIDDDAEFRRLLTGTLAAHGWRVWQAAGGEDGILQAKRHAPDAVLCDLMMPRGNGFEVCRALRADARLCRTRFIVTSGRDYPADRKAAREAGADAYLTKPVDAARLMAELQKAGAKSETEPKASLRFWGVRGSVPTPGPATVRYGGNTTCVEVRIGEEIIILDAGTGLRPLGQALAREFKDRPLSLTLLLTHTHWDHIQGLPFFWPLHEPKNHIRILGYEGARQGLATILGNQMENPYFPIGLRELPGTVRIEELRDMSFNLGPVRAEASFANHPGVCVGYRLFAGARSLAFFPDNELRLRQHAVRKQHGRPALHDTDFARREDGKIEAFVQGADVLIMDAQYDCAEYREHVGWGHGCVDDVVRLALAAKVGRLLLFHHDPDHDDDFLRRLETHARKLVSQAGGSLPVECAREGLVIPLD
jgi:phosphoribosyl 1,2-cyclic phosphodiesterase/CheY-like chemotaxis protein